MSGNYREEHVFSLKQAIELFDVYQRKIEECDGKTAAALAVLEKKADSKKMTPQKSQKRRKNQPYFEARTLLYEIAGVDLTAIHGLETSSILTILSETGTDMSPWRSGDHFAAWLALTPNNRITGGKLIHKSLPWSDPIVRPRPSGSRLRLSNELNAGSELFFVASSLALAGLEPSKPPLTSSPSSSTPCSRIKPSTAIPASTTSRSATANALLNSLKNKTISFGFELTPITEVH